MLSSSADIATPAYAQNTEWRESLKNECLGLTKPSAARTGLEKNVPQVNDAVILLQAAIDVFRLI